MNKKNFYYIIALFLLCLFAAVMEPAAVLAEDTNVADWVEKEQPDVEEAERDAELNTAEDRSLAGIVGRLIFYLVLILGMIYGLIKFLSLKQQKMQPNQAVKLIGGTSLGNSKSLQLVKVGEKVYLIGVGDEVTLIKEFSGPDEIGIIEKDLDNQAVPFANPLAKMPFWKKGGPEARGTANGGFEQLFAQSLNKQKMKQERLQQELAKRSHEKEGGSS